MIMLKPDGKMAARYLYGLEYPPNDMKLGLLEASEGSSISTVEQIILFCYRYDREPGGKYVLMANRVMRIGGGFCALLLIGFLALLWRRERQSETDFNAWQQQ